ncbi:MAG: TIGR00270 family protein [Euryarchaeota archaeon]|nr:TIGR00270 family protein [Euryarchaeota archaeon]
MTPAKDYDAQSYRQCMGACELCGAEGVSTKRAKIAKPVGHNSILECCNRCIESMGLIVEAVRVPTYVPPTETQNSVSGKGISGVDIMTKDEVELANDFHSRIRNARKHRGLSQEDLAKQMNEKIAVIQKTENGIRPTDSLLNKFAKSLDIKLFVESVSHAHTMVASDNDRQMTISDVKKSPESEPKKQKSQKKKGRRIGVSRSGARSRR